MNSPEGKSIITGWKRNAYAIFSMIGIIIWLVSLGFEWSPSINVIYIRYIGIPYGIFVFAHVALNGEFP